MTALPDTQTQLAVASEKADLVLGDVKKLEIRSMLTDQTVEEMEQALSDAHNMSANTAAKVSIQTVTIYTNSVACNSEILSHSPNILHLFKLK